MTLQLRVYAIYGEKRWLLIILVLMNLCFFVITALELLGYPCKYYVSFIYFASHTIKYKILFDLACNIGGLSCAKPAPFQKWMNPFAYAMSYYWLNFYNKAPSLGWIVVSMSELILFTLVLKKADYNIWCRRRSNLNLKHHTLDVMTILARDSTIYFVVWAYTHISVSYFILINYCTCSIFSLGVIAAIISFVGWAGESEINVYLSLF